MPHLLCLHFTSDHKTDFFFSCITCETGRSKTHGESYTQYISFFFSCSVIPQAPETHFSWCKHNIKTNSSIITHLQMCNHGYEYKLNVPKKREVLIAAANRNIHTVYQPRHAWMKTSEWLQKRKKHWQESWGRGEREVKSFERARPDKDLFTVKIFSLIFRFIKRLKSTTYSSHQSFLLYMSNVTYLELEHIVLTSVLVLIQFRSRFWHSAAKFTLKYKEIHDFSFGWGRLCEHSCACH